MALLHQRFFLFGVIIAIAGGGTVIAFTSTPFTTIIHHQQRTLSSVKPLYQSGDKGGGAAIAIPKTKTVTTTVQKQKQKNDQKQKAKPSEPDQLGDFEDAPMYRLFLLGDEIIENISEDEAARIFKSAYQTGEAFIAKFPKEIAETYAEQLTRSDPIIYADVRDDEDKKRWSLEVGEYYFWE